VGVLNFLVVSKFCVDTDPFNRVSVKCFYHACYSDDDDNNNDNNNFRFSPCIFKVNHFYWPTNALNCIKLKG